MSWSYSGDPSTRDEDAIRFEIGDTDEDDQLLSDEEIAYAISIAGTGLAGAAYCCEVLARKFSREADFTLGPLSIKAGQRAETFGAMAKELKAKATTLSSGNGMYVGGIDPADAAKDTGLIQPAFKVGFMDNI